MIPAWGTITIALLGSAVAGVVGAVLRIRHERQERFRDRMLEAAADAAKALEGALHATRVAIGDVEGLMLQEVSGERATEAARSARTAIDAAGDVAGRVDLLFGLGAGDALREARSALRRAMSQAGPTPPELDPAFESLAAAEAAYRRFVSEARQGAEAYGRRRWLR